MYLYRTQHKILWEINQLIIEKNANTDDFWVSTWTLIRRISGLSNKEKRVAMALAALIAKGYTKYVGKAEDKSAKISMTQKGLDALALWEYKQLQHKVIGTIIKESVAIIVAIATIYSLVVSITELKQTQEDLKTLKEEFHKSRKI